MRQAQAVRASAHPVSQAQRHDVPNSACCNMQVGEYAYHADPYTSGQHRTAVKASEASHGRQPFKASFGGRLGGAFEKVQVWCCWRLLYTTHAGGHKCTSQVSQMCQT